MTAEIRIYVEGGGDTPEGKAALRTGFRKFLSYFHDLARRRRIRFKIIPCGGRGDTFHVFLRSLKSHAKAFNILLVDSEASVENSPWNHLRQLDNWKPPKLPEEHCHLMAQVMESWFLADLKALENFYKAGFKKAAIPKTEDVERIEKTRVESSLRQATSGSKKGVYHKIKHGPDLLGRIDADKVQARAHHCKRLFSILEEKMG